MATYKKITRYYYDTNEYGEKAKVGSFIAIGQWANGTLAYARYDEDGYPMEEANYFQYRGCINGKNCLIMQRL